MDTIYALSSGQLPAGVAVVRISGPMASDIARCSIGTLPRPREATLATIRKRNGSFIDNGLALWFPGPRSFTGEDCLELQCHGGRATLRALFDHLASFEGCRPAEAGEFSRRALAAGKMDLQEAESLGDILSAVTETERQLALRLSSDSVRQQYDDWRAALLKAMALLAADIDFVDEEDAPENVAQSLAPELSRVRNELIASAGLVRKARIIRDGFRTVLLGAPNAGKSSLFNALLGEDRVIVSPVAGTTRDSVEAVLDLGGHRIVLVDTAGVRWSDDVIESMGIERSQREAAQAHCLICLADDEGGFPELPDGYRGVVIRVLGKADMNGRLTNGEVDGVIPVSVRTGQNLNFLRNRIVVLAGEAAGLEDAFFVNERHAALLRRAALALDEALSGINADLDVELVAEGVRRASHALESVTGHIGIEDVLGAVFSQFCIGK